MDDGAAASAASRATTSALSSLVRRPVQNLQLATIEAATFALSEVPITVRTRYHRRRSRPHMPARRADSAVQALREVLSSPASAFVSAGPEKSMALWMPARSRPGTSRRRAALRRRPNSTKARRSQPAAWTPGMVLPTSTPVAERRRLRPPSAACRRSIRRFVHLEIGNGRNGATHRCGRSSSKQRDVVARRVPAAGRRARPARTPSRRTADVSCRSFPFFPSAPAAGSSLLSQPRSTIWHSMVLIVTGLSSMLERATTASHGAGQTRPVNSGKIVGRVQRVPSAARPLLRGGPAVFQSGNQIV